MYHLDERDPRFLVIYSGDEEATPADYVNYMQCWTKWLERTDPFGVILVTEPHEHSDSRDDEAEINRIINEFRRDYRERASQITVGFARVFAQEVIQPYLDKDLNVLETWQESMERYAQYNWGIPGKNFLTLSDAQAWLLEQFNRAKAEPAEEVVTASGVSKRVGLYYGSSTGVTEDIAERVAEAWKRAGMEELTPVNVGTVKDAAQLLNFDYLILGVPTWNIGQLQDDWEIIFPQLDRLDFKGRKIAIFGIGDQYGYTDNFLDAMGILGKKLIERGAELIGTYHDADYKFRHSLALVDGKFIGVGIDEVCQPKLTNPRIERWIVQIIGEFALQRDSVA